MAKKLTGEEDVSGEILKKLDDTPLQREVHPGVMVDLENPGDYDSYAMKAKALANVEAALIKQEASVSSTCTMSCILVVHVTVTKWAKSALLKCVTFPLRTLFC